MPRSRLLLDLFQHDARLSAEEQMLLAAWFERTHAPGEDLPTLLVRLGYLTPTASRTLDLMMKGFVARDSRTAVPDEVLRRIREEIVQPALAEARPTSPRRSAEPAAVQSREDLQASNCETSQGSRHAVPGSTVVIAHPNLRPPVVGDQLGKCLLTGVLGRGGHGMVFSALHQTLNISVAVKVLLSDGSPIDDSVRRQLRREAQLLARLNHQNVTRVLDYDDTGVPFVVMELVEGPSLADLIAMSGRIDVARAAEIFTHAAEGLRAGGEVGLVHRDVKPGNILLARNGTAKVADLGLALATTDQSRRRWTPRASSAPVPTSRRNRPGPPARSTSGRTSTPWARRSTTPSPAGSRSRAAAPARCC